ncbi:hypothetical protein SAMN05444156_0451 [Verrucomicrobium sp. GAS474]|uniref:hypothetical protein n=1 Tax=Verrucomicrobium sp. GAS474 TaxID=1882831 RepID=UPI00087AC1DB|nr:hypothetical protein [Verrucomicrobium sp. GAS474]SDT88852.1 hypothetical protein SAMN05444156_0451 [Verrucomicrobium sp. GAS474]
MKITTTYLLGAILVAASASFALAQETSSTTTTTTTQQPPAPPVPPPVTTVQTTTVIVKAPMTFYIRKAESGGLKDGDALTVRASGKVYDSDGDVVGHLTNLSGSDVRSTPVRDEYKIKSPGGTLIASTRPSSAYDSDRKVTVVRQDKPEPVASTTTTTTRETTVTP